jgi:hypothetical protein
MSQPITKLCLGLSAAAMITWWYQGMPGPASLFGVLGAWYCVKLARGAGQEDA